MKKSDDGERKESDIRPSYSVRSIVPVITVTPELEEQILPVQSQLSLKPPGRPRRSSSRKSGSLDEELVDDVHVILKHSLNSQGSNRSKENRLKFNDKAEKRHEAQNKFQLCRRQVYTAFWTNLLMRYRMKIITLFEIGLPILIIYICIASLTSSVNWRAQNRMKSDLENDNSTFPISHTKYQSYFCKTEILCKRQATFIVFTPNNKEKEILLRSALDKLLNFDNETTKLIGVNTSTEVTELCEAHYRKSLEDATLPEPVGIIFTDNGGNLLSYKIRTFRPEIANTLDLFPYYEIEHSGGILPNENRVSSYITTGFVALQSAIDLTFIEQKCDERELTGQTIPDFTIARPNLLKHFSQALTLQMFQFSVFLDLKVQNSTWAAIVFSIVLGYFCVTYFTLNRMILHRSAGILKMLKLHGMSSSLHWLSLLFYEIIFHWITCIGITSIIGGLIENEDPFVLFTFLCFHGVAANCFSLFISSFFRRSTIGAMFGFMISFISYFIPMNLYLIGFIHSKALNFFFCFFLPNWTLANGIFQFLQFESFDSGVDWSSSASLLDNQIPLFPSGICIVIFICSAIFYFGITVLRDDFQTLMKRRYRKKAKKVPLQNVVTDGGGGTSATPEEEMRNFIHNFSKPSVYEEDEVHPCNVSLRNVTVVFGYDTIALDDVSINFHEGQITLLLGYNRAGKSTLANVIAGLISPNSGTVLVNGTDPYTHSSQLNKKIGFCPKSLSLFPSLTVEEHIRLCCMLHGNSIESSKATTVALLKTFKLFEYRRMGVKYLALNQLRKLGLAMAMSNNCSVLILEEPMSEMNVNERIEIWSSLQYLKGSRTIIVTMGSLDDGDAFADRLVLMSEGKIICAGSPSFLNKSYNVGTFVKIRKAVEDVAVGQILFFVELLLPKLGNDFHEVKLSGNEEQEHYLYLTVPTSIKFSIVLHTLESYKDELGISEVHVIHSTLAGIFYKLSRSGSPAISPHSIGVFQERRDSDEFVAKLRIPIDVPTLPDNIGNRPTCFLRLEALIRKHFQYSSQKYSHFLVEFIVSFILVGIFVYFCDSYLVPQPDSVSRQLNAKTYGKSAIPILLKIEPRNEEIYWRKAFNFISEGTSARLKFYTNETQFSSRLQPTKRSRQDFRAQVVTAFSANSFQEGFVGYFASNAKHSASVTLNMLNNIILRFLTPIADRERKDSYRIETFNHPFVYNNQTRIGTVFDVTNAMAGILFGFLLAFITASRIILPANERKSGLKYLQEMAGVRPYEYWISFYICDTLICLFACCCLTLVLIVFDTNGVFLGLEMKLVVFLLSVLYLCWSSLPFSYIFGRLISNVYSGYGQFMMCHSLTGILPILITHLIYGTNATGFYYYLRFVFHIFPSYTISSAFINFCEQVGRKNFCNRMPGESKKKCDEFEEAFNRSHLKFYKSFNIRIDQNDIYFQKCCHKYCATQKPNSCLTSDTLILTESYMFLCLMILLAQGVFYWCILMILEASEHNTTTIGSIIRSCIYGDVEITKAMQKDHSEKGADVVLEQNSIQTALDSTVTGAGTLQQESLIVADLTKVTGFKKTLDHIYFKVFDGTILGLLGPKDSGKSDIIQMIIGAMKPTIGHIYIGETELTKKTRRKYLSEIGFSPKVVPMLPHLTGLQMVELIGRLRGIPKNYLTIHAKKWLALLGIPEGAQIKKCATYSLGVRKRLSFAMALIGNPVLLVFDEPTQSLDDNEQLLFWNLLTFLRKQGSTILLTSSSAEQCSQICTKLVLLRKGAVGAVGTPQEVFSKYPKGWSLMLRLFNDISSRFSSDEIVNKTESLIKYILEVFDPCELTEERANILFFYLHDVSKTLSTMYGHLEEIKESMPDFLDEYAIEEANLDDIIGNGPPPPLMYNLQAAEQSTADN